MLIVSSLGLGVGHAVYRREPRSALIDWIHFAGIVIMAVLFFLMEISIIPPIEFKLAGTWIKSLGGLPELRWEFHSTPWSETMVWLTLMCHLAALYSAILNSRVSLGLMALTLPLLFLWIGASYLVQCISLLLILFVSGLGLIQRASIKDFSEKVGPGIFVVLTAVFLMMLLPWVLFSRPETQVELLLSLWLVATWLIIRGFPKLQGSELIEDWYLIHGSLLLGWAASWNFITTLDIPQVPRWVGVIVLLILGIFEGARCWTLSEDDEHRKAQFGSLFLMYLAWVLFLPESARFGSLVLLSTFLLFLTNGIVRSLSLSPGIALGLSFLTMIVWSPAPWNLFGSWMIELSSSAQATRSEGLMPSILILSCMGLGIWVSRWIERSLKTFFDRKTLKQQPRDSHFRLGGGLTLLLISLGLSLSVIWRGSWFEGLGAGDFKGLQLLGRSWTHGSTSLGEEPGFFLIGSLILFLGIGVFLAWHQNKRPLSSSSRVGSWQARFFSWDIDLGRLMRQGFHKSSSRALHIETRVFRQIYQKSLDGWVPRIILGGSRLLLQAQERLREWSFGVLTLCFSSMSRFLLLSYSGNVVWYLTFWVSAVAALILYWLRNLEKGLM